jgi:hypothetical protein
MRLPGDTFLRSNFKGGDPVRVTAGAVQQNRVANVLKNIRGMGCRLIKPVGGEGKNWLVVVDGKTDVPFPSGIFSPSVHATSRLVHSSSTTTSGVVDFSSAVNSNTGIVEASADDDNITIKLAGWYTVDLQAELVVYPTPANSYYGSVALHARTDTGAGAASNGVYVVLSALDIESRDTGDPSTAIIVKSSSQLDLVLEADDVLDVNADITTAQYNTCVLTVRYLHS